MTRTKTFLVNLRGTLAQGNSMFGPKSPAEQAARRDSVISWANHETVGGYCQYVNFGQKAPQTKPLEEVHGWWSSPRRCGLGRQGIEGQTPLVKVCIIRPEVVTLMSCSSGRAAGTAAPPRASRTRPCPHSPGGYGSPGVGTPVDRAASHPALRGSLVQAWHKLGRSLV